MLPAPIAGSPGAPPEAELDAAFADVQNWAPQESPPEGVEEEFDDLILVLANGIVPELLGIDAGDPPPKRQALLQLVDLPQLPDAPTAPTADANPTLETLASQSWLAAGAAAALAGAALLFRRFWRPQAAQL